ncbi:MAG: transcription termination factor NusA [Bacilli bacterium]
MNSKEFIKGIDLIVKEKNIDRELVFEAMELALLSAYKKNDNKGNAKVSINRETGEIHIYSYKTIVEVVEDDVNEIDYETAKKINKTLELGDTIDTEVTPSNFGRVAASTAKQVLVQKMREAERNSILADFGDKQDELLIGSVELEDTDNYYINLGRTNGILPKKEMIPGEKIEMGSSIKVYVSKVEASPKGMLILLSRNHYGFIKRLFELEIPEINDGSIMVYSVAREAGDRSKVAVYSEHDKLDPVGSCIGEKGSRIAKILKELNGEKLDIIKYDKDPAKFIENALSPAKNLSVLITDSKKQECMVIADNDNFSLAIGKRGSNAKLASKLTHYKIDIKSKEQANEMGINIK